MTKKEIRDKVIKFANHMKHGPFSNIYYIRKYDENDNLIDEYYGMNHMTNYGMRRLCNDRQNWPTNVYIGFGNNVPFDRRDPSIVSRIMDNPVTNINTTIDYDYPLYYYEDPDHDPAKSYITCMARFIQCRLDYNTPDHDVNIAEYGIGENQTSGLWTHSKVYNEAGTVTYIKKKLNERLDFDIFFCMTYPEKMINDAWDQGIFTVITKMNRLLDNSYKMSTQKVFTYRRNDITANRTIQKNIAYDGVDRPENEAMISTIVNDFDLYNQDSDDQRCFCGFCEYTPGWCVLEKVELPYTESFDIKLNAEQLNGVQAYTISNYFGAKNTSSQYCPFTRMHVDHVYMFNVVPDGNGDYGYTNEVNFINNDNHDYCETSMQSSCAVSISREQNDEYLNMYLHINTNTDDAITSFTNINIGTLYATDKYWDQWTLIPNLQHVPEEHQHDRFWITKTNDQLLYPVRESSMFSYNPSCGKDETVGYSTMGKQSYSVFDGFDLFDEANKRYRYCVRGNVVYYPEIKEYYTINNCNDNRYHRYYGHGKWLLIFTNNNDHGNDTYLLTDVINRQTKIVTSSFQYLSGEICDVSYITNTATGIVCIQTYNSDLHKRECIAIDLRNMPSIIDDMSAYEHYFADTSGDASPWIGTQMATAIWGTSCVAYIPNDRRELRIYDFDTNTEEIYNIPDGFNDYKFIYAHSKYIWVTAGNSGTNKTYVFNTDTKTWTSCSDRNCQLFASDVPTWWCQVMFTCVDNFIMMWRNDKPDEWLRTVYYIRLDNNRETFVDNNLNALNRSGEYFNGTKMCKLRYISCKYDQNTGKRLKGTLALVASCGYCYNNGPQGAVIETIDFGEFIYGENITNYSLSYGNDIWSIIPYGEFYIQGTRKIPIEYGIRHRIVGTTRSVTAMNHIKHISGQSWQTYFTHVLSSDFDGIARGDHR